MSELLAGKVQAGFGDASRWLKLFNAAYSQKLGMPVFPGSLNIALDHVFDWFDARYEAHRIWFSREEYGGERDILLLPCELISLDCRRAFFWTPTTAARDRRDPWVVEIVADVNLRHHFGLQDGDVVEVRVPTDWTLATVRDMLSACGPQQRDLLCRGTRMFLFWCLPLFAFALGFFLSPGLKTVLWTLSLGFMGTVCLLNASRCGRIHCYFTGPFFILAAVTSLGYGVGLLQFGPSGWKWIGNITIIGAILLSSIPELVLGRYRRNGAG